MGKKKQDVQKLIIHHVCPHIWSPIILKTKDGNQWTRTSINQDKHSTIKPLQFYKMIFEIIYMCHGNAISYLNNFTLLSYMHTDTQMQKSFNVYCQFYFYNSNKESSDSTDPMKPLVGFIIRIISPIKSFFVFVIVFNMMAKNCKKPQWLPFKGINFNKKLQLSPNGDFYRPHHKNHFIHWKFSPSIIVFVIKKMQKITFFAFQGQ